MGNATMVTIQMNAVSHSPVYEQKAITREKSLICFLREDFFFLKEYNSQPWFKAKITAALKGLLQVFHNKQNRTVLEKVTELK